MKRLVLLTLAAAALLGSCGWFTTTIPASTKLASSSAVAASYAPPVVAPRATAPAFPLTPANVSGKVITVGIMVGDQGGYALHLIAPSEEGYLEPTVDSTSSVLNDFDLSNPVTVAGDLTLGGSAYPSDDQAYVSRVELLFAWVDVTLADGDLSAMSSGVHTVRVVYADVPDLGYQRGDLLYDDGGTWKWADTDAGTLASPRPTSPVQLADVAAYDGTSDGLGNQYIPVFVTSVDSAHPLQLTESELKANAWSFTVVFDLAGGVALGADPATIGSANDLLANFGLAADVASAGDSLGFGAWVEAEPTPN